MKKKVTAPKHPARSRLKQAGLDDSRWGKRIIKAEQAGKFTASDRTAVSDWVTCACGNTGSPVETAPNGEPRDWHLREFGVALSFAVDEDNPRAAADALIDIEMRAAHLAHGGEQQMNPH